MIGRLHVNKSGGNVVNGIIEEYLTENETIDANTFVEFVNGINSTKSFNDSEIKVREATVIDNSRFLIAYATGSSTILKIALCTIENGTITVGTGLQVGQYSDSILYTKMFVLDEETIAVFHTFGGGDFKYCATLCKITNNVLSYQTSTVITTNSGLKNVIKVNNSEFLVINTSGSNTLYGLICTINNNTITVGTSTNIASSSNDVEVIMLSENSFLTIYNLITSSDTSVIHPLWCRVCTITNKKITSQNTFKLLENFDKSFCKLEKISENKIVMTYKEGVYLYVAYYSVQENNIGLLSNTLVSSIQNTYESKLVLRDSYNFDIIHYYNNSPVYLSKCKIDKDNNITLQKEKKILETYQYISTPIFINNFPSLIYVDTTESNILMYEDKIKKSTSKIEGLTKSKCTPTTKGDVWVLNNTEEEN